MSESIPTTPSTWALSNRTPAMGGPGSGRTEQDITDWHALTNRVAVLGAARGWSKAEVARRSSVPDGTFSGWFSGNYTGRLDATNLRIKQWLDGVEDADALAGSMHAPPPFFETRTSAEIMQTLAYAQTMGQLVTITLGAGSGKTTVCEHYRSVRPHVYMATMSPNTKTVHGMLVELAAALELHEHNPAKLHRAIGAKLQRNGRQTLLIIDEAQTLTDEAVNQARSFRDVNKCGVALVGNDEVRKRFKGSGGTGTRPGGPSGAQVQSRLGKSLWRPEPYEEDISAQIAAWGITDEPSRRLLTGIGHKPGALRQIDMTLSLASLLAAGDNSPITDKHIRAAWSNRAVED